MTIEYIDNIKYITFSDEEKANMIKLVNIFDKILENIQEEEKIFLCNGYTKDYSDVDTAADVLYDFANKYPYIN